MLLQKAKYSSGTPFGSGVVVAKKGASKSVLGEQAPTTAQIILSMWKLLSKVKPRTHPPKRKVSKEV